MHVGVELKKHRSKAEIKAQKETNPILKHDKEEKQKENPTFVPHT